MAVKIKDGNLCEVIDENELEIHDKIIVAFYWTYRDPGYYFDEVTRWRVPVEPRTRILSYPSKPEDYSFPRSRTSFEYALSRSKTIKLQQAGLIEELGRKPNHEIAFESLWDKPPELNYPDDFEDVLNEAIKLCSFLSKDAEKNVELVFCDLSYLNKWRSYGMKTMKNFVSERSDSFKGINVSDLACGRSIQCHFQWHRKQKNEIAKDKRRKRKISKATRAAHKDGRLPGITEQARTARVAKQKQDAHEFYNPHREAILKLEENGKLTYKKLAQALNSSTETLTVNGDKWTEDNLKQAIKRNNLRPPATVPNRST
ncbi:hypothetical protein GCM10011332_32900 [Terasakiella brassicae]|uniref:Uncharacterized protein n=1 Tax=Terasakiella brassicae TaxID=1634917 RepID=A0A917C7M2_9PROT|nr:hypothetical protein [Terasakiella brassicae]GGF76354.1 hypothetical protein GCM10011332_32900 [Terasakiella brassicae]